MRAVKVHKAVVGMSLADVVPRSHYCSVCGSLKLMWYKFLQKYPEQGDSALAAIQNCFANGTRAARSGSALALKACADELTGKQVTTSLDFLLGQGLADHNDEVRSQMIAAGEHPRT